jgi:hypothetical protein
MSGERDLCTGKLPPWEAGRFPEDLNAYDYETAFKYFKTGVNDLDGRLIPFPPGTDIWYARL